MAKPEDDQEIYGAPLDLPEASVETDAHQQKPKTGFRYKRLIIIILILLVIGGIIYLLFLRPKPASSPSATASSYASSDDTKKQDSTPAVELKKYNGDFPRIELSYPTNWTLVEKENGITISSPEFEYTTTNKGSIKGNFSVYIRQGAREQEGTYIGRGLAVRDSEKLVYTAPSSTQRPDTNLTLFGLDSADYFSYFFITGDYQLKKGETLGPNYGREAETYIITGGFGSEKQVATMDFNNLDVKVATSETTYKQGIDIVKSIKVF